MTHNVPHADGEPIPGLQHKYRETVLFPAHGNLLRVLHLCFRWAQFIGDEELKFANKEVDQLVRTCDSTRKSAMCCSRAATPW